MISRLQTELLLCCIKSREQYSLSETIQALQTVAAQLQSIVDEENNSIESDINQAAKNLIT